MKGFKEFLSESKHTYDYHTYDGKDSLKTLEKGGGEDELDDSMAHYLKNKKLSNVLVKRDDGKSVHYLRTSDEKGNDYWDKLKTHNNFKKI